MSSWSAHAECVSLATGYRKCCCGYRLHLRALALVGLSGSVQSHCAIVSSHSHLYASHLDSSLEGKPSTAHGFVQLTVCVCGSMCHDIFTRTVLLRIHINDSISAIHLHLWTPCAQNLPQELHQSDATSLEDIKPAFIVFNIDVFSALYVANCLQSSQSWINTMLITFVDIVQIGVSITDIRAINREIRSLTPANEQSISLFDLYQIAMASPKSQKNPNSAAPTVHVVETSYFCAERTANSRSFQLDCLDSSDYSAVASTHWRVQSLFSHGRCSIFTCRLFSQPPTSRCDSNGSTARKEYECSDKKTLSLVGTKPFEL